MRSREGGGGLAIYFVGEREKLGERERISLNNNKGKRKGYYTNSRISETRLFREKEGIIPGLNGKGERKKDSIPSRFRGKDTNPYANQFQEKMEVNIPLSRVNLKKGLLMFRKRKIVEGKGRRE